MKAFIYYGAHSFAQAHDDSKAIRDSDDRKPYRAPHYSCSVIALVSELALSARGALVLSEIDMFNVSALRVLMPTWARMHESARPVLVLTCDTPERGVTDSQKRRIEVIKSYLDDYGVKLQDKTRRE